MTTHLLPQSKSIISGWGIWKNKLNSARSISGVLHCAFYICYVHCNMTFAQLCDFPLVQEAVVLEECFPLSRGVNLQYFCAVCVCCSKNGIESFVNKISCISNAM